MLTSSNLRKAWKRVKANKGKPGIDGVSIEDFPEYLKIHWERLQQQLREETYQPAPVRRNRIPKPDGGLTQTNHPPEKSGRFKQLVGHRIGMTTLRVSSKCSGKS